MQDEFKPLNISESLLSVPTVSGARVRVEVLKTKHNKNAFFLPQFITKTECAQLISAAEDSGFDSISSSFPSPYRSNARLLTLSHPLARCLYLRLLPSLTVSDCFSRPMGPNGSQTLWMPHRLNECFKISRYSKGNSFRPHHDGPYCPNPYEATIYTLILYLNDESTSDLKGGATNFLKRKKGEDGMQTTTSQMEESLDPENYDTLASIRPMAGAALIFKHDMLHEGAPVLNGYKYIIKTEIIFKAIHCNVRYTEHDLSDTLHIARTINKLYSSSDAGHEQYVQDKLENLVQEEDIKQQNNFFESYLQAVHLQQKYAQDPPFPQFFPLSAATEVAATTCSSLPVELIEHCLTFLDAGDILRSVISLSKGFLILVRVSGRIWKPIVKNQFGSLLNPSAQKTIDNMHYLQTDWMYIFKEMYCGQKTLRAAANEEGKQQGDSAEYYNQDQNLKYSENTLERDVKRKSYYNSKLYHNNAKIFGSGSCPLVVDPGSAIIKCGFSGDDAPRTIFPSYYFPNTSSYNSVRFNNEEEAYAYASSTPDYKLLHYQNSYDSISVLFYRIIWRELRTDDHGVTWVVAEDPNTSEEQRKSMQRGANIGTIHECTYLPFSSSLLTLFSYGLTHGAAVQSGDKQTSIVSYYDSKVIHEATIINESDNGDAIARKLAQSLTSPCIDFAKTPWFKSAFCDIKDNYCIISSNRLKPQQKLTNAESKKYKLPDSRVIVPEDKDLSAAEEVMFGAESKFAADVKRGLSLIPDADQRKIIKMNVVLGGGNTVTQGFEERLNCEINNSDYCEEIDVLGECRDSFVSRAPLEVRELVKSTMMPSQQVKIKASKERKYSTWIGGSIIGGMTSVIEKLRNQQQDEYQFD